MVSRHFRLGTLGTLGVLALALTAFGSSACASKIIYDDVPETDAGVDTRDTAEPDAVVDLDAADAWRSHFDAPADPIDPPTEGSYPPVGGGLCPVSPCGSGATCDEGSGWCCGGRFRAGKCMCGGTLGCKPPSVCCALPGTSTPSCVADVSLCPGVH